MRSASPQQAVRAIRVLGVGHVGVSVAAIVMVVVLVVAGTRPNAGFEGIYAAFGLVLAIPTAVFTGTAVQCARLSFREPQGVGRSAVLGATEGVLGLALAAGVAVSGAPGRSPLILPAVILLALALMTAWLSVRRSAPGGRT